MRVVAEPTRGFAFCRNARCPGYAEEEVDALREETFQTFGDNGGDGVFSHMDERSFVQFVFAREDERACPGCGQPREVSGDPRPSYLPLSGHNPMGLLEFGGFDPQLQVPPGEDRTAALEAQLQEMREQMAKLLEAKE